VNGLDAEQEPYHPEGGSEQRQPDRRAQDQRDQADDKSNPPHVGNVLGNRPETACRSSVMCVKATF